MHLEVEQKHAVADQKSFEARLSSLGAALGQPVLQVDCYYAHPARDFAVTDEALRIRRVGEANVLTYKGPKLDQATKTRRETETPLAPGAAAAEQMAEILTALGFRAVAEVRKHRRTGEVAWQGREVEAALDQVDELGLFIELELTVDEPLLETARRSIQTLAVELGLENSERRSYLELLLARRAASSAS